MGAVLLAAPASAAQERITDFKVDLVVEPTGTLLVTEDITYDFGTERRHGIERVIPVRVRYDDRNDRIYPLDVLDVTASPGTPAEYELNDDEDVLVIRVGDPDETITGVHAYRLTYRVTGALDGFPDRDELNWNAVGGAWRVPISRAQVTVAAPAPLGKVSCYSGPFGAAKACASSRTDGQRATFGDGDLAARQGMTVVVGFPTGAVPTPRPVLDERWTLARAFSITPATLGATALVVVLLALVWVLPGTRRRLGVSGRDREDFVPPAPGVVGLDFAPPEGVRPGLAGLLVDKVVRPDAVTATIVDLAVRGYLRLEERPKPDEPGADWQLVSVKPADAELLEYERLLVDGIFHHADGDEGAQRVRLSSLNERFHTQFQRIRASLYHEAVRRGWSARRPDLVRRTWLRAGLVLVALGVVATVVLAALTRFGLAGVPILLAGLVLLARRRQAPSWTKPGAELARQVEGFRGYLRTPGLGQLNVDTANLYSPYLPYALMFGLATQWTQAFAPLGSAPPIPWYAGRAPFSPYTFPGLMHSFSDSSAHSLTSTPPSSSSGGGGGGFSGGGGGGGGGGSW